MTNRLLDQLTERPLLADGAMGTMLHAHGVPFDRCFDELNLSQPATVTEIHRAYIDAGAQLIVTNTFGANRYKLGERGLGAPHKVGEINAAAVSLARRVVDASFKDVLIAGDVGPLGVRLAPFGRVKAEQAYAAFREQIEALVEAGADLIVIETMTDLYEIGEAVRAAKDVDKVPVIATMTFTRDDRTLLGDSPAKVGAELAKLGADLIGVNCSGGPAQVLRILNAMKQAAPEANFAVKPNAGWPEQVGGRIMYPATPGYFGEYAIAFAEAGAKIVYDVRASRAVADRVTAAGGRALMHRVGHAFIKKRMRDENAIFGGEVSGHFYFRENWYADNGMIPALLLLELLGKEGRRLSEILAPLRAKYHISGEINSRVDDVPAALGRLEERYRDGRLSKLDGVSVDYDAWHFNVRPSNTEPLLRLNLEALSGPEMERRRDEVLSVIRG